MNQDQLAVSDGGASRHTSGRSPQVAYSLDPLHVGLP